MIHRRDIDGLRAVAVVPVVLFHAGATAFSGGFVGVDVFFVISGYLIGGIIYRGLVSGTFNVFEFYARRLRRIIPALAVVIATFSLIGMVIFTPAELDRLSGGALAAIVGLSNFLFFMRTDYFSPAAERDPLLMTWSLGVEEQFYFILPFLLIALVRLAPPRRTAGAGSHVAGVLRAVRLGHWPQSQLCLLPAAHASLGAGAGGHARRS